MMRPDYTPNRNPMLGVILALAVMAAILGLAASLLVMTGVLR